MAKYTSKILVINLDSSRSRWQTALRQLNRLASPDLIIERVSAVDGSTLSTSELGRHFDRPLNQQQYHKTLNKGEIGCYLSHRKAWTQIVSEKLDFALVLEDDFVCSTQLEALLDSVAAIKQSWHCIKLTEHPVKRKELSSQNVGAFRLVTYDKVPARTCAQLISQAGAQRLLAASEKFGRPVDIDLQHWWEHELIVLGLKPYIFQVSEQAVSDIDSLSHRKQSKTRHLSKIYQQLYFHLENQRALKAAHY